MHIDSCHSGELDKDEIITLNKQIDSTTTADATHKGMTLIDYGNKTIGLKNSFELLQELFANVGRGMGATILSAAAGTQFAIEDNQLKMAILHTAFSNC